MKTICKELKCVMKNQDIRNGIWNIVAGVINAAEAVIIIAVVSRVNGLKEAGIFSIAFSLANLMMTIGKFGMRNYQVSHSGYDYSFKTFLRLRVATVATMVFIVILYVIICFLNGRNTFEKTIIIFFVCMWYAIEAVEDVFAGKYQEMGHLDIGSKIFAIRWSSVIITFVIIDILFKNVILAAIWALLISLFIGMSLLIYTFFRYNWEEKLFESKGIKVLFKEGIVLCLSSFLYFYITNIPKYAIDNFSTDEVQAIYGYISTPIFVISLTSDFIYQPQLTYYVSEWREHKLKSFYSRFARQLIVIFSLIFICIIGEYILGVPILSLLYHEDLREYKLYLILLLVGGGFLAIGRFFSNMFIIMDEQQKSFWGYCITAFIGGISVNISVRYWGLSGAVYSYIIIMFMMMSIFGSGLFYYLKRSK